MTAKIRNIQKCFQQTHQSQLKNLLVSGCSFTFNNSEEHVCSWPYYLRDLAGFDQVYDCSQSGAGNNHIYNSVINEVETNKNISPDSTFVIVMWSGLRRTDVIATRDLTKDWHHVNNYYFDDKFATLSLYDVNTKTTDLETLCYHYRRLIDSDSQVYESVLKAISLYHYLKNKNFNFIFLNYMDPSRDLKSLNSPLTDTFNTLMDPVLCLGTYAERTKKIVSNSRHPSPDGYLNWTCEHLIPYLCTKNQLQTITP
jgi:hypothetical protein